MIKLALASLVFAIGCSSSSPAAPTIPSSSTSSLSDEHVAMTAAHFAQLLDPHAVPSRDLEATLTHCKCLLDGWTFTLNPCVQSQCTNLCVHGHHGSAGMCF